MKFKLIVALVDDDQTETVLKTARAGGATQRSPRRRRTRSLTRPASCPQAASISSPRVRRTVVTM